jgi:hypothetical protein
MKSGKKTDCSEPLCVNWKNLPHVAKNNKLKKGKHYGKHPEDEVFLCCKTRSK